MLVVGRGEGLGRVGAVCVLLLLDAPVGCGVGEGIVRSLTGRAIQFAI